MAKQRLNALAKGEVPPAIEGAMESAVLAKTRDLSQILVNEILVKENRLPVGARAYGVYAKLPDGTFRNVKSGEILDGQSVANIANNFSVSKLEKNKSILGRLREAEAAGLQSAVKFDFESKADAAKPQGYWADTFKSVLDSNTPEELSVDQYRSIKLALKDALVARYEYAHPKSGAAKIAKAIEQSEMLKLWKYDEATKTYKIDPSVLGLPQEVARQLGNRVNRAMKVMDPHRLVSEFETVIGQ